MWPSMEPSTWLGTTRGLWMQWTWEADDFLASRAQDASKSLRWLMRTADVAASASSSAKSHFLNGKAIPQLRAIGSLVQRAVNKNTVNENSTTAEAISISVSLDLQRSNDWKSKSKSKSNDSDSSDSRLWPLIPYTQKLAWHSGRRAFLCRLFPKYGNYCGPNWSSGRDTGSHEWDKPPVDWLDSCCMLHDIGYDSHNPIDLYKADCRLLRSLRSRPKGPDGIPIRLSLWGEFYRQACIRGMETIMLPYRRAVLRFQENQQERKEDVANKELTLATGLRGKILLISQAKLLK